MDFPIIQILRYAAAFFPDNPVSCNSNIPDETVLYSSLWFTQKQSAYRTFFAFSFLPFNNKEQFLQTYSKVYETKQLAYRSFLPLAGSFWGIEIFRGGCSISYCGNVLSGTFLMPEPLNKV